MVSGGFPSFRVRVRKLIFLICTRAGYFQNDLLLTHQLAIVSVVKPYMISYHLRMFKQPQKNDTNKSQKGWQ